MDRDEVEAQIMWEESQAKKRRKRTVKRRVKKAALILSAPILGPLAGSMWAENDERGWK